MLKVILVDDEPAMLLAMKWLLSKMEGVEIVGSFKSAEEAMDFVRDKDVDLAFLDIKIAADDGLELARSLVSVCASLDVVFTTSHAEFALHAYDVYPLDFMVKPISRKRLYQTISKAIAKRRASSDEADDIITGRLSNYFLVFRRVKEAWLTRGNGSGANQIGYTNFRWYIRIIR